MKIPLKYQIKLKFFKLIKGLTSLEVQADDKHHLTRYACSNKMEVYRATSLWQKEPGTMKWIDENIHKGDVFLDIGANIGIYSLAAAHRLGAEGKVYAIEPHKPSVVSLLRNIRLNNFGAIIEVLAIPLSNGTRVDRFNYKDFNSAVTGSQFGSSKVNANQEEFEPVISEIAVAMSIDQLLEMKALAHPTIVKIDVDGLELDILKGMSKLLTSNARPKSIQVELNVGEQEKIINLMFEFGYTLAERHFTHLGSKKLSKGFDVAEIAHNAIFRPQQHEAPHQ